MHLSAFDHYTVPAEPQSWDDPGAQWPEFFGRLYFRDAVRRAPHLP